MNILLFGEFSGFMNCLKDGLHALGHKVFLASNGDGFKDFPSDFRWDAHKTEIFGKYVMFFNAANIWWHKDRFKGFDVVFFIDPNNVSRFPWLNAPIYRYIMKNNNKVYLSGSGDTKHVFDFWYHSSTKYHSYYEGYLVDNPNYHFSRDKRMGEWEEELLSKIDGYIPIWYEYAEPFRKYPCLRPTIRIPIDVSQHEYHPNVLRDGKVVFYHGVTRACKGTRYIKPAFERMQKLYGDSATFICAEKLPFNEYMKVIESANVIVDDANSYSIAMNGLFSLLKGKLVMGGAEPIANKELGIDGVNPVYNITPDVDQICKVIKHIIENKNDIEGKGLEGHNFIKKYHNSLDIAKHYINLWENDLNS